MPRKPLQPCAHPGCPNLSDERYCELHRKEHEYKRNPESNKKYGRAWKRIRDKYIKEHPLCEMCEKEGRLVPAEEIHHILPVSRGGTHSRDNLMALCRSCHNKIHIEMGGR